MNTARIIVNGAFGKMGALACETIAKHPDFQLVARLGKEDKLEQTIAQTKAQIVVDLTQADCAYANCLAIIQQGASPVIGTSGLVKDEVSELQKLCAEKSLGGIIVPNFSIGAVLMMQFAAKAASLLPNVEIIETHHPDKQDSPSGTAVKTAEMIANARLTTPQLRANRDVIPGARGASAYGVNVHSLRLPGIVAKQEVIFGTSGETLSIIHNSIDRISFMPGLILACQKVQTLNTLYYGLDHFI